jgi:hypothetical protein
MASQSRRLWRRPAEVPHPQGPGRRVRRAGALPARPWEALLPSQGCATRVLLLVLAPRHPTRLLISPSQLHSQLPDPGRVLCAANRVAVGLVRTDGAAARRVYVRLRTFITPCYRTQRAMSTSASADSCPSAPFREGGLLLPSSPERASDLRRGRHRLPTSHLQAKWNSGTPRVDQRAGAEHPAPQKQALPSHDVPHIVCP